MSPVEFKKRQCPLSLEWPCPMSPLRCSHVAGRIEEIPHVVSLTFFLMSLGSMSHVDFKKCPCRRVECRGRGPYLKVARCCDHP